MEPRPVRLRALHTSMRVRVALATPRGEAGVGFAPRLRAPQTPRLRVGSCTVTPLRSPLGESVCVPASKGTGIRTQICLLDRGSGEGLMELEELSAVCVWTGSVCLLGLRAWGGSTCGQGRNPGAGRGFFTLPSEDCPALLAPLILHLAVPGVICITTCPLHMCVLQTVSLSGEGSAGRQLGREACKSQLRGAPTRKRNG